MSTHRIRIATRFLAGVTAATAIFATSPFALADEGHVAITEYKQTVATRIFNAAKASLTKAPVKALSVVGYTIDASGNLIDAWIVRSAGELTLDERALTMLKRSVPLPPPPTGLFANDPHAHLSEAFVFTVDGRFRLQSLIR